MENSVDPDQLASSELICIYPVCNGKVYPGSAGQGLIKTTLEDNKFMEYFLFF